MRELLERDRYATLLGAELLEASADRVVVGIDVHAHHLDEAGTVSSGVLFSLADCVMSLISNREKTAVAVATHFLRAGDANPGQRLTATGVPETPASGRAETWLVTVEADDEVVASFTGTTLRLD